MNPSLWTPSNCRSPSCVELAAISWLSCLHPAEQAKVSQALRVIQVGMGEYLCEVGQPAAYWFGLLDGLLKISRQRGAGQSMTCTGVPPGGWLGEGAALKRSPYRHDILALRKSLVAVLPVEMFHWLLDHSLSFNRFILNQLNERLAQWTLEREIDRLHNPDVRVALSLAALFDTSLYPGAGPVLRITQQELASLVGLSRQRVNEALSTLEAHGAIHVEYGGVRVLEFDRLRSGQFSSVRRLQPESSAERRAVP